jgi:hypothetical protein
MMDLAQIISALERFNGPDLSGTLSRVEAELRGASAKKCSALLETTAVEREALAAAAILKRLAGQVNVTIHALGILLCLPHILYGDEMVEYVSLGAGNTGREFDLETNRRIAEFKFIRWRGGPESIRQNSVFKDFFLLADNTSDKKKYLYVLGTAVPLKFLNARRALSSVLSKDKATRDKFYGRFGDKYERVADYYQDHRDRVTIVDVSPWVPELIAEEDLEEVDAAS